VIEFAIVLVPLCVLLFGIITFGVMLSFRQSMTQAAAEGARAAAAAPVSQTYDYREPRAQAATNSALGGWSKPCNAGNGMTCTWVIADCGTAAGDPPTGVECMTVQLTYDYEHFPLVPEIPLIGGALPHTLVSTSVVEVNSSS
jgi:hypothetical protein